MTLPNVTSYTNSATYNKQLTNTRNVTVTIEKYAQHNSGGSFACHQETLPNGQSTEPRIWSLRVNCGLPVSLLSRNQTAEHTLRRGASYKRVKKTDWPVEPPPPLASLPSTQTNLYGPWEGTVPFANTPHWPCHQRTTVRRVFRAVGIVSSPLEERTSRDAHCLVLWKRVQVAVIQCP